ncbi:MAG: hypothetical protein M5T61_02160 [Acidimicrobiia bacterium]|nr:hypothetical protein [Acidimicrobiia bacterium]
MDPTLPPEDPPRVTARHLRRTDSICALRLAKERAGKRGAHTPGSGFEVANRITADARQAHAEMRVATPGDFPPPTDLMPEQQTVYAAASVWYVTLFGAVAARAANVDEWSTVDESTGTLLSGPVGLVVECADGRAEVRSLALGRNARPPDPASRAFTILRIAPWAGDRPVELVWADLVAGRVETETVEAERDLATARDLLERCLDVIVERVADPRPQPGQECAYCRFVAECGAHR